MYVYLKFLYDRMSGMQFRDIVYRALDTGRTILVDNFDYINPVRLYNKITRPNWISLSSTEDFEGDTTDATGMPDVSGEWNNISSSATPIVSNIPIQKVIDIIIKCLIIGLQLLLISLVTNHAIMHPPIVRAIIFAFTAILVFINPIVPFILIIYYMFYAMWRFYMNTRVDPKDKKRIMPFIYALLPLTTSVPKSTFDSIVLYPFRYSPGDDLKYLVKGHAEWIETLINSFKDAKKTLEIGNMKNMYEEYKSFLNEMHAYEVKNPDGTYIKKVPFTQSNVPLTSSVKPTAPPENIQSPEYIPSSVKPTAPTAPTANIQSPENVQSPAKPSLSAPPANVKSPAQLPGSSV
jgi:hypothetical protein